MSYLRKDLKLRAIEAKKRLASGYFQKADSEESILNKQIYHSNGVDYLDEERMYKIVCKIMQSDDIVTNPLGQLIDKSYYNKLDYSDRQRYIFKLSETFIKLKQRYISENKNSNLGL